MTAGMEGKTRQASSESRAGPTASTILSASSSMKIREPMNRLAAGRTGTGRQEGMVGTGAWVVERQEDE